MGSEVRERGMRELSGRMVIFYILMEVWVTLGFTFVQTPSVYLRFEPLGASGWLS